jgi:antitoxin VapB
MQEAGMQKTAKIFMNNRSQAVRLPKEFQFSTKEVYIRKEGDEVILSPRPKDWSALLNPEIAASEEFMQNVEKLPLQERKF